MFRSRPAVAAEMRIPRCERACEPLGTTMPDTSGTNGDDVIVGEAGADVVSALDGHDIVITLDGGDTIDGGEGDDDLRGGAGQDTIHGGGGDDIITGGLGADWHYPDWLYGDDGDDTFVSPNGVVDGGAGRDTLQLDLSGDAANILVQSTSVQW